MTRILSTLALAAGLLMLLAAMDAQATPIRPDIRKLVEQSQQDSTAQSMPARAGWDGPEMPAARQAGESASLEALSGRALSRAERAELLSAATPDPRAILGIAAVICLLRMLKTQEKKRLLAVTPRAMEDSQDRIAA